VKGYPGSLDEIAIIGTGGNYRLVAPRLKPARQGDKGVEIAKGSKRRQNNSLGLQSNLQYNVTNFRLAAMNSDIAVYPLNPFSS
jgi:hypothetical protein